MTFTSHLRINLIWQGNETKCFKSDKKTFRHKFCYNIFTLNLEHKEMEHKKKVFFTFTYMWCYYVLPFIQNFIWKKGEREGLLKSLALEYDSSNTSLLSLKFREEFLFKTQQSLFYKMKYLTQTHLKRLEWWMKIWKKFPTFFWKNVLQDSDFEKVLNK